MSNELSAKHFVDLGATQKCMPQYVMDAIDYHYLAFKRLKSELEEHQ